MNRKPVKARKQKSGEDYQRASKRLWMQLGGISGVANKGNHTWFHLPFHVIFMIVISFSNIRSPKTKQKYPKINISL